MSIKAYKNYVVPFPCEKSWKWMLDAGVEACDNCKEAHECIQVHCSGRGYYNRNQP